MISFLAGIKVAGIDFVPKDLIFASAEPKSQATAEGPLPDQCKWRFGSETRIAKREDATGQRCVRYYYKTTIALQKTCPEPNDRMTTITRSSERITSQGPFCADTSGKIAGPNTDAHVISSGTTSEGKNQDIVVQPDGTRITLLYDDKGVVVTAVYADGTSDSLKQP